MRTGSAGPGGPARGMTVGDCGGRDAVQAREGPCPPCCGCPLQHVISLSLPSAALGLDRRVASSGAGTAASPPRAVRGALTASCAAREAASTPAPPQDGRKTLSLLIVADSADARAAEGPRFADDLPCRLMRGPTAWVGTVHSQQRPWHVYRPAAPRQRLARVRAAPPREGGNQLQVRGARTHRFCAQLTVPTHQLLLRAPPLHAALGTVCLLPSRPFPRMRRAHWFALDLRNHPIAAYRRQTARDARGRPASWCRASNNQRPALPARKRLHPAPRPLARPGPGGVCDHGGRAMVPGRRPGRRDGRAARRAGCEVRGAALQRAPRAMRRMALAARPHWALPLVWHGHRVQPGAPRGPCGSS